MLISTVLSAVAAFTTLVSAASFTNPLKKTDGSDPFIVYDGGYCTDASPLPTLQHQTDHE